MTFIKNLFDKIFPLGYLNDFKFLFKNAIPLVLKYFILYCLNEFT